jgi:hypothetical protein
VSDKPDDETLLELEPDEQPLQVLTDDASWDAELQALVAITSTLQPLEQDARVRVLIWARSRFLPNHLLVLK